MIDFEKMVIYNYKKMGDQMKKDKKNTKVIKYIALIAIIFVIINMVI